MEIVDLGSIKHSRNPANTYQPLRLILDVEVYDVGGKVALLSKRETSHLSSEDEFEVKSKLTIVSERCSIDLTDMSKLGSTVRNLRYERGAKDSGRGGGKGKGLPCRVGWKGLRSNRIYYKLCFVKRSYIIKTLLPQERPGVTASAYH